MQLDTLRGKIQKIHKLAIACCYLLPILSLSCKTAAPASEIKHNANEPVRGTESWQWLKISEQEYFSAVVPYLSLPDRSQFIAPSDGTRVKGGELVQRMQFWLDQIHRKLKTAFPNQLKNVPDPQVIILRDADANAFVSPVPVCIDVPVRLNPELPVTASNTVNSVSFTTDGDFVETEPSPKSNACVHRTFSAAHLQEIVRWFDAKSDNCRVKFEMDSVTRQFEFILSKSCPLDPELDGVAIAKSLIVATTSNWVTINTGMIAQFPDQEWMTLPTILHELGHFYRSHLTVFPKEYNYFYRLASSDARRKPTPDASLKERGKKIYESAKLIGFPIIDKQMMHTALYYPVTELVHRFCKQSPAECSANQSCSRLNQLLEAGTLSDAFGQFPDETLPDDQIGLYRQYEQLVLNCSGSIGIAQNRTKGKLTSADIQVMVNRGDLGTLIGIPQNVQSLKYAIGALQHQIGQAAATAKNTVDAAEKDGLVRYTIEMEADEFGMEQFVRLGFEPKDWLEADFVFNRDPDEQTKLPVLNTTWNIFNGNVDNKTCEQTYRANWTYQGRRFVPDRGGYYDPHPNNCFRSYDIWREIAGHGYVKQSAALSQNPPGRRWVDLAKLAASLAPTTSVALEEVDQPEDSTPSHGHRHRGQAAIRKQFIGCPALQ